MLYCVLCKIGVVPKRVRQPWPKVSDVSSFKFLASIYTGGWPVLLSLPRYNLLLSVCHLSFKNNGSHGGLLCCTVVYSVAHGVCNPMIAGLCQMSGLHATTLDKLFKYNCLMSRIHFTELLHIICAIINKYRNKKRFSCSAGL